MAQLSEKELSALNDRSGCGRYFSRKGDLGGDYKSSGTCRQCLRISGDEGTVDEEVSIFDLCIQEPVCGLLSHFIGTQFPMK